MTGIPFSRGTQHNCVAVALHAGGNCYVLVELELLFYVPYASQKAVASTLFKSNKQKACKKIAPPKNVNGNRK